MAHIKIKRGLDIPIKGKPQGEVQPLARPGFVSLNLSSFEGVGLRLKVAEGDTVQIGQPLVEDKKSPGRFWTSPGAGVVSEIRRGPKRRLLDIVIKLAGEESFYSFPAFNFETSSRESLTDRLKVGGLFAFIRTRPFNRLADPHKPPRSIFIKAMESAPFVPPAELQIAGLEEDFQAGINALQKLTDGPVHLVYRQGTACRAFAEAEGVCKHTAEGPHPVASFSLFIQEIDPIVRADDIIWTVNAYCVAAIGHFLRTGKPLVERVISIAGPGIVDGRTGYFKVRQGAPVESLLEGRIEDRALRFISGDPLMGQSVERNGFLGWDHFCFCVIPENSKREFLHFFRVGADKFSCSRAYLSGHLDSLSREYPFTTNLHGEERAFIDPALYQKVMPLDISVMHLVKAIMAKDYELAEEFGLLEVDPEDFALPTFVCPSKIEMVDIVREALAAHAEEVLS